MEADIIQIVQELHDCPSRLVLVTAGAGTQALSDLLSVAGATRTLLEALVPYSEAAFDEFLGQTPAQYVAANTAKLMAGRALTRATWLASGQGPVAGMACTATIITDRPKRGDHRAHISIWRPERLISHHLNLMKGARDRTGEENLVSRLMLNVLAESCGSNKRLTLPIVEGDQREREISDFGDMTKKLAQWEIECFGIQDDGQLLTPTDNPPRALLCGAFNPLHDGHLTLAQAAAEILSHPVAFELSVLNADKSPLSIETTLNRLAQFAGRWTIFASNAPTFIQKARLYPGTTFVVGYDTAERILQPRYYQNSQEHLDAALSEIRQMDCDFLVAGRVDRSGTFKHLQDLNIPAPFTNLFKTIPNQRFRKDISSTELRRTGQRGSR